MRRRKRLLIGLAFGFFIFLVGWAIDYYLTHLGISPSATVLDDLAVGGAAALLAYGWVSLVTQRHAREQAAQRIREEAVIEERNRMAREFHDTVAQTLAAIAIQLDASESLFIGSPEARKRVLQAADLTREALSEAREAVWNLRPEALRGTNLAAAVARLAKQVTARTAIRVDFSFEGPARQLPSTIEKEVLRIGQEALSNVVRHARASKVNVVLKLNEEELELSVEDDGVGFARERQLSNAGFGLTSMQDRASALGGICWIYSRPGQGTSVQAVVPVRPAMQ